MPRSFVKSTFGVLVWHVSCCKGQIFPLRYRYCCTLLDDIPLYIPSYLLPRCCCTLSWLFLFVRILVSNTGRNTIVVYSFFFFFPFISFAHLFFLPPSLNSNPGLHSRLFSPPPSSLRFVRSVLVTRTLSPFFLRRLSSNIQDRMCARYEPVASNDGRKIILPWFRQ